jgi:hypothetical protein
MSSAWQPRFTPAPSSCAEQKAREVAHNREGTGLEVRAYLYTARVHLLLDGLREEHHGNL